MGVVGTYLSAVAAGALTVGVAAANVVAVPPDTAVSPQPTVRDIDLAAVITIPIIDIVPTVGPITVGRQIFLTLGAVTNRLFAQVDSTSLTKYDLPGLNTDFQDTGKTIVELVRVPGQSIGAGLDRTITSSGAWDLLGVLGSSASDSGGSSFDVTGLTGGTEGIGAALGGALSNSVSDRAVSVLDSGFTSHFNRTLAAGGGQLSFIPFDGFKAVGGGTLLNIGEEVPGELDPADPAAEIDFKLGSLQFGAGGQGHVGGDVGLCLGSAQGTGSCGGRLAFASLGAPVIFDVHAGDSTNIISGNFESNNVDISVANRQLSVTGAIGGSVKIGNLEIGRPIPINIQIPRASSMMLAGNRQSETRDSFRAVPGNSGSDNETGGRHRAPLRDAIADVKKAVNNAVAGKHAAAED